VLLNARREMRCIFSRSDPEMQRARWITRLLLAWLLGSGIPLAGIALTLVEQQNTDHTRLFILLGLLTGAGIVVLAYTSILAARSVADPLRALHRTMERVANGDLNATVPIADSGEIGDLQLRFNRMTAGLREREHLLRSGVSTVVGEGQMSPPGR
jgi:adenylate cyclase